MKYTRYFTVAEANALVPWLEQSFTTILQLRGRMRQVYGDLERLGEPPTPETLKKQDGSKELREGRARFRGFLEAVQQAVQEIEGQGIEVKDLDIGLCDFRGRRIGKDVYLCWRYGEKRIEFFHDLTAGFSGRQPLSGAEDLK